MFDVYEGERDFPRWLQDRTPLARPGPQYLCLEKQRQFKQECLFEYDYPGWIDFPNPNNNWPTASTNHGAQGMCMGFLDGHAAFVFTGKPLVEAYMGGHYHPGTTNGIELNWVNPGPNWTWK